MSAVCMPKAFCLAGVYKRTKSLRLWYAADLMVGTILQMSQVKENSMLKVTGAESCFPGICCL